MTTTKTLAVTAANGLTEAFPVTVRKNRKRRLLTARLDVLEDAINDELNEHDIPLTVDKAVGNMAANFKRLGVNLERTLTEDGHPQWGVSVPYTIPAGQNVNEALAVLAGHPAITLMVAEPQDLYL